MSNCDQIAPHAIVARANWHVFRAGERIDFAQVRSRMLLWCRSGNGRLIANGSAYDFETGGFLFLPWDHALAYLPDPADPFHVGGVHIIPDCTEGADPPLPLYHRRRGEFAADAPESTQRDAPIPGFDEVFHGDLAHFQPGLSHLLDFIVPWFARPGLKEERHARNLAALLLSELIEGKRRAASGEAAPPALRAVVNHVKRRPAERHSIDELAHVGGCSPSTLSRMFKRHLGVSPGRWTLNLKLDLAAELLSSTGLRIGEVGAKVGIDDPYHFSKLFKSFRGVTPSRHRAETGSPLI